MGLDTEKTRWKANYFGKLTTSFDEYPKCFLVTVDNVGSKQMQKIRSSLRGSAVLVMGKNTMMKKAMRNHLENNPDLEKLIPLIKGNIGFVFTKDDLSDVREKINVNQVAAPAKAGAHAPVNVTIPAQNTGLGPEKTSFFQALSIPTKISRGTIEILSDVPIIKVGDKVGASEATLLNMLNISPFSYGLVIKHVYDSGSIFDAKILDITETELRSNFMKGVQKVAALSLGLHYPNMASLPHMLANGYKNLLAIAVSTDINFKEAEKIKEYIKDPSKFAALAPKVEEPKEKKETKKKEEEKKKEDSEHSDEDMGLGLFD
ncbi:unnamed protein product [Gordionus sp. m RMFG-2023]|uniref:large ribosomal subunit protein uL10-like n=1 Tax=Gordionus sp. m RMFG-2023 TaxID=3053472 RepID=UPI0030E465D3